MRFFDTNVLVYAATDQDPRKNRIAAELISHAIQINHDGCISTQVLQEFCNTMQGKLHQSKELIDGYLDYYRELLMTDVTIVLMREVVVVPSTAVISCGISSAAMTLARMASSMSWFI